MPSPAPALKGRGASTNPAGRFERLEVVLDEPSAEGPQTRFLRDVDLLAELARHGAAAVFLSMTTFDSRIVRRGRPGGDQLSLFGVD